MGLPRNPNQYLDIRPVLDAAVANGGGTYALATAAEAVRWRQRAYGYRKLLWEEAGGIGTPYDKLVIKLPTGSRICTLTFNSTGVFSAPNGQVKVLDLAPDGLEEMARDFAKKLTLEDDHDS